MRNKTKVVHSQSKYAWNVIGDVAGGKYKIARVPYQNEDSKEYETLNVKWKYEALKIAEFISDAFNKSDNDLI